MSKAQSSGDLCDVCGVQLHPEEIEVCDVCFEEIEEHNPDAQHGTVFYDMGQYTGRL